MDKTNSKEIILHIVCFVLALLLAFGIRKYVFLPMEVKSESMETTIMTHDRILGYRLAYRFGKHPQRGDIVSFSAPLEKDSIYLKRVIGLPGETITIDDGKVFADEVELKENYLDDIPWGKGEHFTFQVPPGHYLMLGDNRNHSADSRYWPEEALERGLVSSEKEAVKYAFISEDKILAKVMIRESFHPAIYR